MKLGDILIRKGFITVKELEVALSIKQIKPQKLLGEILEELYFVSSKELAIVLAEQAGKEYINLKEVEASLELISLFPPNILTQLNFLPVYEKGDKIFVAAADPYNLMILDVVKKRTGKNVEIVITEKETLSKKIQQYIYVLSNSLENTYKNIMSEIASGGQATVIPKVVEFILNWAIINEASDIHISPSISASYVFFRIDGTLHPFKPFPIEIHNGIVSRLKVMSNLDIAEQRLPQDGSFSHAFMGANYDFRVSTIPSTFGENVVLRVLKKDLSMFNIGTLGFKPFQIEMIESISKRSQGIFLITGPTGSGKTTTLYSILRRINALERNIVTVEDPVEYKFPFIKQTQINMDIGYNFENAIRAFLRQDPDVMLIGEIRDKTTADSAIRSAITGHLVLSTLHTNDSISSIPRLLDLGVAAYMIASSLIAVSSQRLARKLCNFCKKKKRVKFGEIVKKYFKDVDLSDIGLSQEQEIEIYEPVGCNYCKGIGYAGRSVIAEIFEIDEKAKEMIETGEPVTKIKNYILEKHSGYSIKKIGLLNVLAGITSPEEIHRVSS